MPGYDPKRPRRGASADDPAPVDALIDLAAHSSGEIDGANVRVVTAPPSSRIGQSGPEVTPTPGSPPVGAPTFDDPTARVVLAMIAIGVSGALVAAILLRRRRRR